MPTASEQPLHSLQLSPTHAALLSSRNSLLESVFSNLSAKEVHSWKAAAK